MIAAYAISGMMAGIFNRFGKIGVVIGFALGNVLLAYVSNGYTVELIHFKEILIAFIRTISSTKQFTYRVRRIYPEIPNYYQLRQTER